MFVPYSLAVTVDTRICATPADLKLSRDVYNAVCPRFAVTASDVEAWNRSALHATEYVASVDGIDAGSAAAAIHPQRPDACFTLITVLPEQRRRGAGSALYEAVSAWAATHGVDAVETRLEDDDDTGFAFATKRGFVERSRESGLELDLSRYSLEASMPPPGVEIYSLAERPELAVGTWDVAVDAFPDVPGDEDWTPPPRERWVDDFLLSPSTPTDALLVAAADDEVIGYAKLRLNPDGRSAWHGMTAVKGSWRRRGVARALKTAQIAWAKEHGVELLMTTNEVRNAPMRGLNESLGYVAAPGRVMMRGPLAT